VVISVTPFYMVCSVQLFHWELFNKELFKCFANAAKFVPIKSGNQAFTEIHEKCADVPSALSKM